MSGLAIPPPRTTLQLYRHLLRETTYLPPAVKPFFWDRICTRFRLHQRDAEPQTRIQKAHKGLRYLRSANAGHLLRMRRILMMGFGRTGRRRRELIEMILRRGSQTPRAGQGAQSVETESTAGSPEEDVFWDDWLTHWDKAKVVALAKAQASVDLPEHTLPAGKVTDPYKAVPSENIWGKPLAKKLARSKLRKEYKNVIKRILPPVEEAEWELLRSLAAGEAGVKYDIPKRRTVALSTGARDHNWNWTDHVLKPVRAADAERSRPMRSLSGELDDTSPFPRPPMGIHRLRSRSWRRLYADIWGLTPTMKEKENQQGWHMTWGKSRFKISGPTRVSTEFFEGVASTGKKNTAAKRSSQS